MKVAADDEGQGLDRRLPVAEIGDEEHREEREDGEADRAVQEIGGRDEDRDQDEAAARRAEAP